MLSQKKNKCGDIIIFFSHVLSSPHFYSFLFPCKHSPKDRSYIWDPLDGYIIFDKENCDKREKGKKKKTPLKKKKIC